MNTMGMPMMMNPMVPSLEQSMFIVLQSFLPICPAARSAPSCFQLWKQDESLKGSALSAAHDRGYDEHGRHDAGKISADCLLAWEFHAAIASAMGI